jgi:GNAT superfamily N-acetyltransferase
MSTSLDFVLRKATARDGDALFALACAFATSFAARREAFERAAERILSDEAAWLGVAETGQGVVGYCLGFDHYTFYANGRVSWVEELVVADTCRRRGIGRALVSAFEAWAHERGSTLVALATRRAGAFYEAIGYEQSADYYRKVLV